MKRTLLLLGLLGLLLGAWPSPGFASDDNPRPDHGDAPDSSNHFGSPMSAYLGVPAGFPTVYQPLAGPVGPRHLFPRALAWLGPDVSSEANADLLPDQEGFTNIDPVSNIPNRDRFDDGVQLSSISTTNCGMVSFNYQVTAVAAGQLYLNAWFDFNRSGTWGGTQNCLGNGAVLNVDEWAVQNEPIVIPGPGVYNLTTPAFPAMTDPDQGSKWMRVTLSNQPAPAPYDGRGPIGGYSKGETEDYHLGGPPPNLPD